MTLKEFRELERIIRDERFESSSDALTYGAERAIFEQRKLKKIIEAAKQVEGWKTSQEKIAIWQRQMEKSRQTQARFEKMRDEMRPNNHQPAFADSEHEFADGFQVVLR